MNDIKKMWIGGVLYTLLFAGSASDIGGRDNDDKCGGTELWAQKILTDSETDSIVTSPIDATTIAELVALDTEGEKRTKKNPRLAFEEQVVRVTDVLIRKVILENDNDYHLVIQDRDGNHMIAEIVDPDCANAQNSAFADEYYDVRATMDKYASKFMNYEFTITGVLFKDRFHNQTGAAPNNLEIHPVLKLRVKRRLDI